ncbi:hypothetical protein Tco_0673641 [Tanacetum coccineum]
MIRFRLAAVGWPHTNFFRAFTASSTIPSIYIQQFWDTVRYVKTTGSYNYQLDEKWFDLTKDTLRDALQITPVDNNNPFSSPLTPDALINFLNKLGYPKGVRTLSDVVTNDMFQPWRALTIIINLCLRERTSGSPLHLPNEEFVLGYLKFSAKGSKREVFGIPIPNNLITADIQGEQYYNAYMEKVANHQRYLADEEVSDPDSPAPKPAKATKPEATKQSKPLAPKAAPITKPATAKALKPTASQPPKPTPATTEPSKKDQSKKHKLVEESSEATSPAKRPKADEGVPVNEPRFGDEEAHMKKAVEESLKDVHAAHQGPLPPMVIREPESGKFQPLPEVQGKGKEKVGEEQAAQTESNDDVSPEINPEAQDECQAGLNPDFEATDASTQQNPEQMDEGFIATAYPKVQENLKLTVEEQVILEEPASSTGTLSSLQHLAKDFSIGDQFFNDKPSDAKNEKTTAETKAESMVSFTIHQDTSTIPPMTSPVIDLITRPDSPNEHRPLPAIATATATATTTTTIITLPLPPQP